MGTLRIGTNVSVERPSRERHGLAALMRRAGVTEVEMVPVNETAPIAPSLLSAVRDTAATRTARREPKRHAVATLRMPAPPEDATEGMRAASAAAYDAARADVPAPPSLIDAIRKARGGVR
jgi:hypothetical protein